MDAILGGLDAKVDQEFSTGEAAVRKAFTADLNARMDEYKRKRYSGPGGSARWTWDLFADLPEEANRCYTEARALYERDMDRLITRVADLIGKELTAAKDRIAKGRADIKAYVQAQPKNLQKLAQQAAGQFASQFDQLENDVDAKKDALVDDLATKYSESKAAVEEEITAMQEENKGLWSKAKAAVGGAIRTIIQLKDLLTSALARAAGAIGKVIKDPIGFLGKFVNAVKGGIVRFGENIAEHLRAGLQGWLMGSLSAAGIQLPAKFDLKGIIGLVLSLLGLTWPAIRARIAKHIPEKVMSGVEKSVAFIQVVLSEGVGGLWKWVVEKLGDIKEMVMGQIREFVITKIVKAGITWLISMLNPAAAFIKACKMIYDVVMFFVEKAAQIKEFVDSVLDSVESIASGGVGAVAGYIEKTLAKMVPVLLGFLASLLGLGGISEKIKEIIATVQKPVGQVVDKLIAGAVKIGKKLSGKIARMGGTKKPTAKNTKSHEVRLATQEELVKRGTKARDISELRSILAEVRTEMGPKGLISLEARPTATENIFDIRARASANKTLIKAKISGKVKPGSKSKTAAPKKRANVTATALVEYKDVPDVSNLKFYPGRSGKEEALVYGGGGVAEKPAPGSTRVKMTGESGRTLRGKINESHAELHVSDFLSHRHRNITTPITAVDLKMKGWAPCRNCATSLSNAAVSIRSITPDAVLQIDCRKVKLYPNEPNPISSWAELGSLLPGWALLHPPESLPIAHKTHENTTKPTVIIRRVKQK